MLRPALRQADFDTEKNVILEEIAMYKDNPFWVLYERGDGDDTSASTRWATACSGTAETITALERDQMQAYFAQRVLGRQHRGGAGGAAGL